ncbi:30S ribosomal protein S9, mitochondrial isoform X1 [Quercus lobata]|uniref:30S ribosomal protein S9, mitochondrial isoform X1 n=1 Tax=Quercus lobata TaxID=97700 RepID=UPI001248368F|nr:30S ribosomal protein S9, mitochondrial isoform X1 [Quercus lobata]
MLSRLLPKPSHLRRLTLISPKPHSHSQTPQIPNPNFIPKFFFSSNNNGKDPPSSTSWNLSHESDSKFDQFFAQDSPAGNDDVDSWLKSSEAIGAKSGEDVENRPWNLVDEDKDDVFGLKEEEVGVRELGDTAGESSVSSTSGGGGGDDVEREKRAALMLEREKQELTAVLKGPNRAFGDLIAASGITDEMLDSLIALKDLEGIEGLPPLSEIEEMRYEKNTRKSSRAEIERQKQEEVAKARVRQVDEKGRAYGTGRRKCSIARVFLQPGDGKFVVNDKEFDVYFPMLDHRAALLRPFSETKTLGLWDVNCTVKGGGVSGQVGAIRLGISRALQNWEPDLRPALRDAGFLTRDSRVVERKKPGKAKARKSFQWVKR